MAKIAPQPRESGECRHSTRRDGMPDLDAMIKAKSAAAATLLKLPGVTGVGVGYREKGGETDECTIRVMSSTSVR